MVKPREINHIETIGRTLMVFMQTARVMSKYIDSYFYNKCQLSFIKFMVLKILASRKGTVTHTEIAEWTQTELHNITQLIGRMKKENLVYTERSDEDKRKVYVFITDEGQRVLDQALPVAREIVDKVMSSITEYDAGELSKVLEVLRNNSYRGIEDLTRDSRV